MMIRGSGRFDKKRSNMISRLKNLESSVHESGEIEGKGEKRDKENCGSLVRRARVQEEKEKLEGVRKEGRRRRRVEDE